MTRVVIHKCVRASRFAFLALAMLSLSGCEGNVGVGVSVGVPIGNHGYMSVGGSRWY